MALPAPARSALMAERKAFLLRLDPAVWTQLERLAQTELRSVNAQIEFLLRDALARRGQSPRSPPTAGDDHNSGSGRI
jgi:hypothetical protein